MELVSYGDIDKFGVDDIKITWSITEKCNFNCWYCQFTKNDNPYEPTPEVIFGIIDKIKEISKFKKISNININSAEPTTIPDFDLYLLKLAESVNDDTCIQVSSNLSAPISTYKNMINSVLMENKKFTLFSSFHRGSIDVFDFFDKVETISNLYKDTTFQMKKTSFMIYSEKCIETAHMLHNTIGYDHHIFSMDLVRESEDIELEQIWDESSFIDGKDKIVRIYKDNDYKYDDRLFSRFKTRNFRKYVCRCWGQNIIIYPNGDVGPCNTIFKDDMMNLFEDGTIDFIKNTEQIVCPEYQCICDPDIPKYKMLEYSKLKEWTKEDILKLEKL